MKILLLLQEDKVNKESYRIGDSWWKGADSKGSAGQTKSFRFIL
jgi:hypothetical protein